MIALRKEFDAFSRRTDAKIGLLKEIVERIQKGEEIDVEGLLGAGNKEREQEWEEGMLLTSQLLTLLLMLATTVIKEIERDDEAWEQSRNKKSKANQQAEDSVPTKPQISIVEIGSHLNKSEPKAKPPSGFY